MKTYKDYTDDELMAMSDDELDSLIDLQCAINGVPLLPECPEPVNENLEPPDSEVFEVAGFFFAERDSAERVMEAINREVKMSLDYDWNFSSDIKYLNGYSDTGANITVKKVYSQELYDSQRAERAKIKQLKDIYTKRKIEYDDIMGRREESASEVFSAVRKARDERDKKILAHQRYDRYVKLANGDAALANKFFSDAYPDDVHYILKDRGEVA